MTRLKSWYFLRYIGWFQKPIEKEGLKHIDEILAKENELIKKETKLPVEEFKKIVDRVLGGRNEA